jgi:serine protease
MTRMTHARSLALSWCGALWLACGAWAEPARVIVHFKTAAQQQTTAQASASVAQTDGQRQARRAAWLGQRHGLALSDGRVIDAHRQVLTSTAGTDSEQLAATLRLDPEVAWAEPDRRRRFAAYPNSAPNDPLFPTNSSNRVAAGQWYLRAPTSTFVSAINAQAAWSLSTGVGTVVADIDTGVLFNHPDLIGKFYDGYDFVSSGSNNRDGDGLDANAADPGDWETAGECKLGSAASDSSWHGTQTSSVIGAKTNNGVGMAGVAPDAMLLPVRVLADCGGWDSDIMFAMLWSAGLSTGLGSVPSNPHPAKVLNLSLGGEPADTGPACPTGYQDVIQDITNAGVVIVAAAGNEAGLRVDSPANCSGVIAVSGLRHAGSKVGFANVGPEVALSAPAGNCVNSADTGPCLYTIITATNKATQAPGSNHSYADTTTPALGTSFSTPMVAATAALMMSANPALTPAQVKALLQSSARSFPTSVSGASLATCHAPNGQTQTECLCTTTTCGAGMLDAYAAVQAASPTAVPTVSISAVSTAVVAGNALSLDGSASVASTGRTLQSYAWVVSSGGGIASISGASNQAQVNVNTSGAGTGFVALTLTVTDNLGAQASRTVWVAVNAASTPLASIQLPATSVMAGDTLVADGSASSGAQTYAWQVIQGSDKASISGASNASSAVLQSQANQAGQVALALTVDDGSGHLASQVANVDVVAVHPAAALSASATSVTVGQAVSLDASQSTATTGRTVASYAWRIVTGANMASFSSATDAATASLATSAAGTVRVEVTITDNLGATDVRTLDIAVLAPNSVSSNPTDALTSKAGGGGGAVGLLDLLALALVAAALGWRQHRAGRVRRT